jgi:AcrR family transcriptional regulator
MRADARRNRRRLLTAARCTILDKGADVPLEAIAREAGVGIATLYRHFPDRTLLVRAVAADVLERCAAEAGAALAEEPNAFAALRRFMHRALDAGVAVTNLLAEELDDDETMRWRDECSDAIRQILDRAHQDKTLRAEVSFADIGLALVRFTRPIGAGFDPSVELTFAHRHLDIYIDGLHFTREAHDLAGPALALDDLRAMKDAPDD